MRFSKTLSLRFRTIIQVILTFFLHLLVGIDKFTCLSRMILPLVSVNAVENSDIKSFPWAACTMLYHVTYEVLCNV